MSNPLPDLYLISTYQLPLGLQTCSRVTQSKPSELKKDGKWFYLTNLAQVFYHLEDKTRYVYHASIPNRLNTRYIEDGHHDGASSFSFYEGLGSQTIAVLEEYDLAKSSDVQRLIDKGLFSSSGGLMGNQNPENYAMWCIANHQMLLLEQFITSDRVLYQVINNVIYSKHADLGAQLAKLLNVEPLLEMEIGFLIENATNKKRFDIVSILCEKLNKHIHKIPIQEFNKIISTLGVAGDITNFSALIKAKPVSLNVFKEMIVKLCTFGQFDLVTTIYNEFERSNNDINTKNMQVWCEIIQWLSVYQQNTLLKKVLDTIHRNLEKPDKAHLADLALASENTVLKNYSREWLTINPSDTSSLNLEDACKQGCHRQIQSLIKQGVDVTANSNAALHYCCEFGFVGAARLLLDNGADVNAWMHRAIKLANKYQFTDLKQLLLDSGAEDKYFK